MQQQRRFSPPTPLWGQRLAGYGWHLTCVTCNLFHFRLSPFPWQRLHQPRSLKELLSPFPAPLPDWILETVSCLILNTVLSAQAPTSNQGNPWEKPLHQNATTELALCSSDYSNNTLEQGFVYVGGGGGCHEFGEQYNCKKSREGGPRL